MQAILNSRNKSIWIRILHSKELYLFCLPGIIITLIFHYWPIYGVQIAFRDYSFRQGIWGSQWVGLEHFIRFFKSPYAWQIIFNTLILSFYSLAAGFPIPIILALMLNSFRHKKYGKVIQMVTYAPNFISVVVMCGMLILFLSPRIGIGMRFIGLFGQESTDAGSVCVIDLTLFELLLTGETYWIWSDLVEAVREADYYDLLERNGDTFVLENPYNCCGYVYGLIVDHPTLFGEEKVVIIGFHLEYLNRRVEVRADEDGELMYYYAVREPHEGGKRTGSYEDLKRVILFGHVLGLRGLR